MMTRMRATLWPGIRGHSTHPVRVLTGSPLEWILAEVSHVSFSCPGRPLRMAMSVLWNRSEAGRDQQETGDPLRINITQSERSVTVHAA